MTAPSTYGLSTQARNLQWLLTDLVEEVPGIVSVAVVSSDGLLLLSSDPETPGGQKEQRDRQLHQRSKGPRGAAADLATIVSGLGSLTTGAAELMDGGRALDEHHRAQEGEEEDQRKDELRHRLRPCGRVRRSPAAG